MLFREEKTTHRRNKCTGGSENIHDEMMSNVLSMLRNGWHLIMTNMIKSREMKMRQHTKYNM